MKRLLLDVPEEEHPIINLPDVTVAEIKCVLALLYRGEVNLYKRLVSSPWKLLSIAYQCYAML